MQSLFDYTDYRNFLNDFYSSKKSRKSTFSHRFIEGQVGISSGYFSRIVNGEKNIGDTVISRFSKLLKLNKKESAYFENLVKFNQAKDAESRTLFYQRMLQHNPVTTNALGRDQFSFFQEPHHVAVHALLHIYPVSTNSDFAAIGKLLIPQLSAAKVEASIALMLKLQLIRCNSQGRYELTKTILSTGDNPKDITLRRFLQESFERARTLLDAIPESQRTITVMTVSISEPTYVQIKEKLDTFKQEVRDLIAKDTNMNRVYQIGMHVMPMSHYIEIPVVQG